MSKGHDKDSASKICGFIKKKTEGRMSDWRKMEFFVPITETVSIKERNGIKIKGVAINETTTRNNVKYIAEELEKSAQSLIGKPLLKDHNNSVDAIVGIVTNAKFNSLNKNIEFEADIIDDSISKKVEGKLIKNVSVGAYVRDLSKKDENNEFTAKGIEFVELSLVAVPADPNAGFSFDYALDNARILKEAYEMDEIKEIPIDKQMMKCPECGKEFKDKIELDKHMTELHPKKQEEEKLENKKIVEETKQPIINVNIDLSKFEGQLSEMQKKIESLQEQLNKKVEEKVEIKEEKINDKVEEKINVTKGKIVTNVEENNKRIFKYGYSENGKPCVNMNVEYLYEKYPKLKGK
jgi:uncharacterized C2H2 Zn-finger protein